MGYLLHILLAFGALGVAAEGWLGAPLSTRPWFVFTTLAAFLATPWILGHLAKRFALRGKFAKASRFARLMQIAPLVLYPFLLGAGGFYEFVTTRFGEPFSLFGWPGLSMPICLAPWLAMQLASIDARSRLHAPKGEGRTALRAFQTRMLISSLLPILIYMVLAFTVSRFDGLRVRIEEIGLWNAGFSVLLLGSIALSLPLLLRHSWRTESVPSGLVRDVYEVVARRANFRCSDLLLWRTGGTMANAAIVGFGSSGRVVLVSDALLSKLDPRELAGVFAHEIAHAKKHHVLLFGLWVIGWFLMLERVNTLLVEGFFSSADASTIAAIEGGVFLSGFLLGAVLFGFVSRRVELQADLYAAKLLGTHEPMVGALAKVGGNHPESGGYRHFSSNRRIEFLQRAQDDPKPAARLHRLLRFCAVVGVLIFVGATTAKAVSLVQDYGDESVRARLRLGHYEAFLAQLEEQDALEESPWIQVVEMLNDYRGEGLLEDGGTEEFFRDRVFQELKEDRPERALLAAELALLRGHESASPVVNALEAWTDGETERAEAELAQQGEFASRVLELLRQPGNQ